jgi:hypothetical protein
MPGSDIELSLTATSVRRDLEPTMKWRELAALLPRPSPMRHHDHLVSAEVAQVVRARGRGAGIADLSALRLRQRLLDQRPRTLKLAVDVWRAVLELGYEERSENLELDVLAVPEDALTWQTLRSEGPSVSRSNGERAPV